MNDVTTTKTARPPVARLRDGRLQIAIWERESENGLFHHVTCEKRYQKNGKWASTQSFAEDDLLALSELLHHAYQEIKRLKLASTEEAV